MLFQDEQRLNGTLYDYHVPTIADLPDAFVSPLVDNGDGPGPDVPNGVGEGALADVPCAIANALAGLGIHVDEPPLTPERVWRAMHQDKVSEGHGMPCPYRGDRDDDPRLASR